VGGGGGEGQTRGRGFDREAEMERRDFGANNLVCGFVPMRHAELDSGGGLRPGAGISSHVPAQWGHYTWGLKHSENHLNPAREVRYRYPLAYRGRLNRYSPTAMWAHRPWD
jgi:hypothetical protein